jgi:putative glutamine amidotransferase
MVSPDLRGTVHLIGINTDLIARTEVRRSGRSVAHYTILQSDYYDSLLTVGAIPTIIPPLTKEADLALLLDTLDGVILTDGDDLDSKKMGKLPHPAVKHRGSRHPSSPEDKTSIVSCSLKHGRSKTLSRV